MKIAIIYTTKGGTTRECAELLARELNGHNVTVADMNTVPDLNEFDNVVIGFPIRGAKAAKAAGSNIYLLDRFEGTGILIECGFLSNPDDRVRLNDPSYRKRLSAVIFYSIAQYISEGGR